MLVPLLPAVLDAGLWTPVDGSCLPNREKQEAEAF